MKGDFALSSQLLVGIIIAIITVFLLYVVFPRSGCDAEAQLSALEIKKAVECASGTGPSGCSKTAVVKLCQEDAWSLVGFGWMQNYFGLMVPEYLLYYQKFPTIPVEETHFGAGGTHGIGAQSTDASMAALGYHIQQWSDSYPFERATIGQRFWDIRPTLTQFKQFYKTKYLQEPCTSDTGLCVNIRGREDVLKINLSDDVKDVKLFRLPTAISDANPKFHLVAPCFAKVSFKKSGDEIIATLDKGPTSASNYCYFDEAGLAGAINLYAGEWDCRAADIALTILSCGSKAAIQEAVLKVGGKTLSKAAQKEIIKLATKEAEKELGKVGSKVGSKAFTKKASQIAARETAKKLGKELSEEAVEKIGKEAVGPKTASFWGKVVAETVKKKAPGYLGFSAKDIASTFGIPCIDLGDLCRGVFSCAEALWWPGWPFEELTPEKMTSWKNTQSLTEILGTCCEELIYGTEQDFAKISCDSPEQLVDLVKTDLHMPADAPLTLKNLTDQLKYSEARVKTMCSNFYTDNYQTCTRAEEVLARTVSHCDGLDSHTYAMKSPVQGKKIQIFARIDYGDMASEEDCTTKIKTSYFDGTEWKAVDERTAAPYPDGNSFIIDLGASKNIAKIKIEDSEKKCHLESSSIAIDPNTETVEQAQTGVGYELPAYTYKFFFTPADFDLKASELCKSIKSCSSVQKWLPESLQWVKYLKGTEKEDFSIAGGDKIGIQTTEKSSVTFVVKSTTTTAGE